MGAFWPSIPEPLLKIAATCLSSSAVAIETGTYLGNGTALLSRYFNEVITIERDLDLAEQARNRFATNSDIQIVMGSSREVLSKCIPAANIPALFWLDAHFSGGITAGSDDKCPLLFEVSTILSQRSNLNTIVYIDDIRGATGVGGWPTLTQICAEAIRNSYVAVIIDDVMVLCQESLLVHFDNIAEDSRASKLAAGNRSWGIISAYLSLIRVGANTIRKFI